MKDKQPPSPSEREFNEAWASVIDSIRQESMLHEAVDDGAIDALVRRVMIMQFTFTPGITKDQLLDGVGEYLKMMLADADFRRTMGWADAPPASHDRPRSLHSSPAPQYTKPHYHDYAGRPAAFEKAKREWRRRMQMLGFDPDADILL